MIKFETINELTLKVTTTGNDVIFTKTGAFIAGDCSGNTNYRFEKVLLGPQKSLAQAALGSLMRRVTGENIPLTKVTMNGPSETYYAESAQHVLVYKLEPGETILSNPKTCLHLHRTANTASASSVSAFCPRKVLLPPHLPELEAKLMWRSSLTETRSHSAMYSPTIRSLSIRML